MCKKLQLHQFYKVHIDFLPKLDFLGILTYLKNIKNSKNIYVVFLFKYNY